MRGLATLKMSVEISERIVDIADRNRAGMYRDFDSAIPWRAGLGVRGDGVPVKRRLVVQNDNGEVPWEDANMDTATIRVSVGSPDKGPTAGTFDLSYNGSSTGLTGIAWNISAAALQALLNANAAVTSGGVTVSVTLARYQYRIVWSAVGARFTIAADITGLQPAINTTPVSVEVTGDGTHRSVQVISLTRPPYALVELASDSLVGAAAATVVQDGSATKREIVNVKFNAQPYDGTIILNFPKPQITAIVARANVASPQQFTIGCIVLAAGSGTAPYFECADDVGPVWVYMTVDGGFTSPGSPSGGRALAVAVLSTDDTAHVASKVSAAIDADSKFIATHAGPTVTVTASTNGSKAAPADITSGFTVAETVAGSAGGLKGTYFGLRDIDGTVAVWFSQSSSTIPDEAALLDRAISVTVAAGDSQTTVATALATAIDADAKFSAIRSGGTISVTDVDGGSRDLPISGTAGMTLEVKQGGEAVTASFPWNATATEIKTELGNLWNVRKRGLDFTLTSVNLGAQPAFDLQTDSLVYPATFSGVLDLSGPGMVSAFAASEEDALELVWEEEYQFPGREPFTYYRETVIFYREVINRAVAIVARSLSSWVAVPATLTSAGTVGQMAGDANYLYYCYATNSWRRIPGSVF